MLKSWLSHFEFWEKNITSGNLHVHIYTVNLTHVFSLFWEVWHFLSPNSHTSHIHVALILFFREIQHQSSKEIHSFPVKRCCTRPLCNHGLWHRAVAFFSATTDVIFARSLSRHAFLISSSLGPVTLLTFECTQQSGVSGHKYRTRVYSESITGSEAVL